MPYTAEVSRTSPSCFLFLIDQSGSMEDPLPPAAGLAGDAPAAKRSRAQALADAINRLLQNLVIKCAKSEGVRDYFHVGVLGYGGRVEPAFGGALAGRELVPVSEIAEQPARVEERSRKVDDGAGGLVDQTVKFPIWFDARANGGTPMCEALARARTIVEGWTAQYPAGFPPIVINITDGESTDGDPTAAADQLRAVSTEDGGVLLFSLHISSHPAAPTEFPGDEAGLPDKYAQLLFRISSPLPEYMRAIAAQEGFAVIDTSRGFVFNADMVSIIRFLDIGTRPSNLR